MRKLPRPGTGLVKVFRWSEKGATRMAILTLIALTFTLVWSAIALNSAPANRDGGFAPQIDPAGTTTPTPTPTPVPPPPSVCTLPMEDFADVTTLIPNGWAMQNNSSPIGTTGWFQGISDAFSAQSGAANSYVSANFLNGAGLATISNWLITPPLNLQDGAVFRFWTRTLDTPHFPDRLQVRVSTNGSSTDVGTLPTDVGDFTTLLLDINPTYTTTDYPSVWTQFTITLSGLGTPVDGRIAFRYFVENGGPNGLNSDYIGIDSVDYDCNGVFPTPTPTPTPAPTATPLPCNPPTVKVSVRPTSIRKGQDAVFTFTARNNCSDVVVIYVMKGMAKLGRDYTLSGTVGRAVIPAGQGSTTVTLHALFNTRTHPAPANMKLKKSSTYYLGTKKVTVTLTGPYGPG